MSQYQHLSQHPKMSIPQIGHQCDCQPASRKRTKQEMTSLIYYATILLNIHSPVQVLIDFSTSHQGLQGQHSETVGHLTRRTRDIFNTCTYVIV